MGHKTKTLELAIKTSFDLIEENKDNSKLADFLKLNVGILQMVLDETECEDKSTT